MPAFSVMLVEDAGIVANDIDQTVSEAGFDMAWKFSSGEQALEELEESSPDLILMDIQLSGEMDGIEATRQLREQYDIPVVFLTAYSNPDTIQRAGDTGAVAYLVKPLDKEDLISIINWIKSGQSEEKPAIERGEMLDD